MNGMQRVRRVTLFYSVICIIALMMAPDGNATGIRSDACKAILEPLTYAVDDRTSSDLNLDPFFYALMGPYFPRTYFGASRLKELMTHPLLDASALRERQALVKELIANDTLREGLRGVLEDLAPTADKELHDHLLKNYSFNASRDEDTSEENRGKPGLTARQAQFFNSAKAFFSLFAYVNDPNLIGASGVFIAMSLLLRDTAKEATRDRKGYSKYREYFRRVPQLGQLLNNASTPALQEMGQILLLTQSTGSGLSQAIRTFRYSRASRLLAPLDFLFFYGTYAGAHADKALRKRQADFETLFAIVAELDVLLSFADMKRAHPDEFQFPVILNPQAEGSDGNSVYVLELEDAHHAMIYSSDQKPRYTTTSAKHSMTVSGPRRNHNSVGNSVQLGGVLENGKPGVNSLIITGPNAAGKSTYIRMIALNILMAQIGAPVLAKSMRLTPLRVRTSIENKDSVETGKSFFDAESDRVIEITNEAFQQQQGVLLILDEILRGTNPEEKHAAEVAFIEFFAKTRNFYILATHDQGLPRLVDNLPNAKNAHVTADYDGSKLTFSYRVNPGPAKTTNAIDMMEMKGLHPDVVRRAREILGQNIQP